MELLVMADYQRTDLVGFYGGLDVKNSIARNNLHRIKHYITFKSSDEADSWKLLVMDFSSKRIFYIDPSLDRNMLPDNHNQTRMNYSQHLNAFARNNFVMAGANGVDFRCELYPYQYYTHDQTGFDAGLYALFCIYFTVKDCPIYIREGDSQCLRRKLCWW